VRHRHLDYPADSTVAARGPAALDDLLDRGDLADWAPLARAVANDPHGALAETVLRVVGAHPMYGTAPLWRAWIVRARRRDADQGSWAPGREPAATLVALRRRRDLTQRDIARRIGTGQSDVSKLERRPDPRLSTLRAYVAATGGELRLIAAYPGGEALTIETASPPDRSLSDRSRPDPSPPHEGALALAPEHRPTSRPA